MVKCLRRLCVLLHLFFSAFSEENSIKGSKYHDLINPNDLPLFPSDNIIHKHLDRELLNANKSNNFIPQIIWLAVRNSTDQPPEHITRLFERNPKWLIKIVGNYEKDYFINTVFNGTKVQWAYHAINPSLGAAKADIWRCAILWCYGG
jgi:hypothetical protein